MSGLKVWNINKAYISVVSTLIWETSPGFYLWISNAMNYKYKWRIQIQDSRRLYRCRLVIPLWCHGYTSLMPLPSWRIQWRKRWHDVFVAFLVHTAEAADHGHVGESWRVVVHGQNAVRVRGRLLIPLLLTDIFRHTPV